MNQEGKLRADRLGWGREFTGHTVSPADAERIIKLVASSTSAECNEGNPILSAEFPGCGSRFARGGLTRLEQLIQEAGVTVPRELIAEAVNLVIHIERCNAGRTIKEIIEVEGGEDGKYKTRRVDSK